MIEDPQERFFLEGAPGEGAPGASGGSHAAPWTVTELNRRVRDLLLSRLGTVWVEGELSGIRYYGSRGRQRVYGTLKDEGAEARIVIWEEGLASLRFRLEDGLNVIAQAEVTLYPQRGQYQLVLRRLVLSGVGELERAFQQLRERLDREGLFDPARKRPLPPFPFRIGVITSLQGAALQDFLQVTGRRNPALRILIAPSRVQGEGASAEVIRALERLQRVADLEAIVITRGGGSLEDLWAFNEEPLVRAVAACRLPVLSAVGHEVDTTLCDLTADLRMPTPSAAAEQVAWPLHEWRRRIEQDRLRVARRMRQQLENAVRQVQWFSRAHGFRRMGLRLREATQRVDEGMRRLPAGLRQQSERAAVRCYQGRSRNRAAMQALLERRQARLDQVRRTMEALGPLGVLERGYAIARRSGRPEVIRAADQVKRGEHVEVYLRRGVLHTTVEGSGPGLEALKSTPGPDRSG